MIIGELCHQRIELILLLFVVARCKQFLNDFEYRYDVPFFGLTQFRHKKDRGCQYALGCIVEVCVLSKGSCIHSRQNDRFGNDLCILFCLGFVGNDFGMLGIQVHILVYKVEEVVAVRSHRVTQVNDGNVVAIVFGCDGSVVSHDIALSVGRHEGHSGGTGILDVWVQPKCSFTDTCRTDHHAVNVARVYKTDGIISYGFATYK